MRVEDNAHFIGKKKKKKKVNSSGITVERYLEVSWAKAFCGEWCHLVLEWSVHGNHRRERSWSISCTSWESFQEIRATVDSASSACQNKVMSAGQHYPDCPLALEGLITFHNIFATPCLVCLLPTFLQRHNCKKAFTGLSIRKKVEMMMRFHLIWAT